MSGCRRRGPGVPAWTLVVAALALAACESAPPPDRAELQTIRTVGLAYLEENRLEEAAREFSRLVELAPREPLGYANLGLTYLRMGRLEEAEAQVRRALELRPEDADVRLILVEILRAAGRDQEARAELERALAGAPEHLRALYALASLDADSISVSAARRRAEVLGRIVALAPGNVAARVEEVAALAQAGALDTLATRLEELRQIVPELPVEGAQLLAAALDAARAGDAQAARGAALAFQNVMRTTPAYQQGLIDLRGPGGVLVGFPVVTFSQALAGEARDEEAVLAAIRFTDATETVGLPAMPGAGGAGVVRVADLDGDGDRDLFAGGGLLRNDPTGFVPVPLPAVEAVGPVEEARFGDVDDDGVLDLYVAGRAGARLLRGQGDGTFRDVTSELGVPLPAGAALFGDFDQDGDLDLVVAGPGGSALLRNNLDGTFTDMSAWAGLGAPVAWGASLAFGDLDDDDDLDFLVADPEGPLRLYDNERLGRFTERAAQRGLELRGAGVVVVGDYNNDGWFDLLTAPREGRGFRLHLGAEGGRFSEDTRPRAMLETASGLVVSDAAFVDFDNDGWLDVLLAAGGERGVRLFRNADVGRFDDMSPILPAVDGPRRLATADFGDDGDLDVFVSTAEGRARLLRHAGGNGNRYLKMQLVGLSTGSGKNNHFGIGAKVEVRAGALYQMRVVTAPEIHIGLGQRARADVVRVRWPNGVPQNLFYPGANQSVVEEQILKGSCPFLYTWDGEGFTFVTDLMWKSALGMPLGLMAAGDTEYAPAAVSREYVRIPGDALRPREGAYELRITGELWEVFYIDEVELVALDHPDSVEVFVDERFTFASEAELRPVPVARRRAPRSAVDERGRDVLELIRRRDDVYLGDFEPERYQGVSREHALVVDLGPFPDDAPVYLFLRGWIFPTDASINVALSQNAALSTRMPVLEVVGPDGAWIPAVPALSFPAGKDKMVVQELTGLFPTDDHRVRIRTNMNIYWDHVFFTVGRADAPIRVSRLEPGSAHLRFRGFSRMFRKGGRNGPHWFDYDDVRTDTPWRPIQGRLTRYGAVDELTAEADDAYVIMGPGDELALRFPAAEAPELPEGWTRTFLIYTEGWIKDADLNTAEGWRVEPLPFHGMSRYPYGPDEAYPRPDVVERWHTRMIPRPEPLGGPLVEVR